MWYLSCSRWLLLLLFSAASATAAAAPPPAHPLGVLRLGDAAALALRNNPALLRFGPERAAASARLLQAGLRPNPELGIDIENAAGSGAYRRAEALEATLRLALVYERVARRDARLAVARTQLAQVDVDWMLVQLDVLAETTRLCIDVSESQEQLALAQRGAVYAEQTLAATQRRVSAGAASSLEINRARIALQRAQLEQEHYEHQLDAQRRQLAAQWGETDPQFERLDADLRALPVVADYTALVERLRRSPAFARYDVETRLREADLQLARAQAQGNPLLGAGVRRMQASGDYALVASLLIPLPVRNRNQGAIAEAEALRERVAADRQNGLLRSQTALYVLLQELRHARTLVEAVRDQLLPQAEEALTLTRHGYANGRYSQLDLLDAQKTRLELERELLSNAADYHRTLAAIERMTALAVDSQDDATP